MTKNLKHVQLFESYVDFKKGFKGPIEIGFFSEGGIGSHPAIINEEGAEALANFKDPYSQASFYPVIHLSSLPYAFMYILDFNAEKMTPENTTPWGGWSPWKFYPLTKSQADNLGGEASYNIRTQGAPYEVAVYKDNFTDPDDPKVQEMLSEVGYSPVDERGEFNFDIGIISGVKVNCVYFSPDPEETHGGKWGPTYYGQELSQYTNRDRSGDKFDSWDIGFPNAKI